MSAGGGQAAQAKAVHSCLNILRRTPPSETEQNLAALAEVLSAHHGEDAADKLRQSVDSPLKDAADPNADGRKYIVCDHNRDGDSHRSPWSNTYDPPLDDSGMTPSDHLRQIEVRANELFDSYRELYYGKTGTVSSVYLWDLDDGEAMTSARRGETSETGFAGCFLIKKTIGEGDRYVREGSFWNSIHVVRVCNTEGGNSTYTLTSSLLFSMDPTEEASLGETNLAGSVARQTTRTLPVAAGGEAEVAAAHVANIGRLIEEVEIDLRSGMDAVYIQKTREVVESLGSDARPTTAGPHGPPMEQRHAAHAMMLNQAVLARRAGAQK